MDHKLDISFLNLCPF